MKKKFIACLLALTLTFPMTISAEDTMNLPDISGLSLEELYALRDATTAAILGKGGGYTISKGIYKSGEDIKAGSYTLYVPESEFMVAASIIDSHDIYNEHIDDCKYVVTSMDYSKFIGNIVGDQSMHISLDEDDILILEGTAYITDEKSPFAP